MSGGSYDYLYRALMDAEALGEGPRQQLGRMLERLLEDYPDDPTVRQLQGRVARFDREVKRLADFWQVAKAVEWCDSGDSNEIEVARALREWWEERMPRQKLP